jgi:thiosulfate reductase cytochrome b subunit
VKLITLADIDLFIGAIMSAALRIRVVFSGLMSGLMSFLMSAWVTWLNLGFGPAYLNRWLHAFIAAWPAAFLIVVLFGPAVQRFTQRVVQLAPGGRQSLEGRTQ